MPNYCYNSLTVKGDPNSLENFYIKNKSEDSELSLNKSVPVPDNLDDLSKEEFLKLFDNPTKEQKQILNESGRLYSHHVIKWGTKWDVDVFSFENSGDKLIYNFDSAWSPPLKWLKITSKKYPELKFKIIAEESGFDFYINIDYENGIETIIENTSLTEKKRKLQC